MRWGRVVGFGLAAWVLLRPRRAHGMAYAPLDVPKSFAPGVWTVDSVLGPVPVRMTVLRLEDGSLVLHSPTRFSAGLREQLERLGPIRHLVAPNSAHWVFVKAWQDAVAGTTSYAAPGLRRRAQVRRSGVRLDRDLSDEAPEAWRNEIDQVVVPGGVGFREVAMFHRPSRTLLMTDLVQNFEAARVPWALRPVFWLLGNLEPGGHAPAHLRAVMGLRRQAARAAALRVLAWAPERIVMGHGRPIEADATGRLRRSLDWLVG